MATPHPCGRWMHKPGDAPIQSPSLAFPSIPIRATTQTGGPTASSLHCSEDRTAAHERLRLPA